MEFADVVKEFSTSSFTDPLGEDPAEKILLGRISVFNDVTNSGVSSQRRVLETPIGEEIPESKLIADSFGSTFIVGHQNNDYWEDEVVRLKYPLIPAGVTGVVGTIGQTLEELKTPVLPKVYASLVFQKRDTDEKQRSDYFSGFQLFTSAAVRPKRGDIFSVGTDYYRVRMSSSVDTAGFCSTLTLKLEGAISTLDIFENSPQTFDPVTETYVGGSAAPKSVTVFIEDIDEDYENTFVSYVKAKPGDKAISVLKADAVISVGTSIGDFSVLSIDDRGDFVTAHCRISKG